MKPYFHCLFYVLFVAGTAVADALQTQSAALGPGENELTVSTAASEVLAVVMRDMACLNRTLAQVVDASSADQYAQDIMQLMEKLLATDESVFEEEDAELLAASIAGLYASMDKELARLEEHDFYGNAALQGAFGAYISPAEDTRCSVLDPSAVGNDTLAPEAGTEAIAD
ncbi:MAG: hypothetical protein IKA23_08885 [Akkermansia sp.]|nr:hypothetical protein [Akkermansia sp.]